jgi:bile acid:Na+ symporter, BASS family
VNINQVINLVAGVALFEMMIAIGLRVRVEEIILAFRDWPMLIRAAVANYLVVPAVAIGLLLLFRAPPLVAAGFLVAAVCPGAPFGPAFTVMARGNEVLAVGLMVALAGSSAILAPILLHWSMALVAGSQAGQINVGKIIGTLLGAQLLPLGIGLAIGRWRPSFAQKMKVPASRLSAILNLGMFILIIAVQFRMLMQIHLKGYVGMSLLLAASVATGWMLGGSGKANRTAMVMATSVRNVGVALVIATSSFAGTAAVTATTVFAVFQTVLMAIVALLWGRATSVTEPAPAQCLTS